jgi:Periplasmic binding protein
MRASKRSLAALVAAGLMMAAQAALAQTSDGVVKIGVLTDMSSLYTDITGVGSVVAAKMAVEDSEIEKRGYKVEVISADHLNKPDVGSQIARQWYDGTLVVKPRPHPFVPQLAEYINRRTAGVDFSYGGALARGRAGSRRYRT